MKHDAHSVIDDDTAWAAAQRRDRSFDGRFFTGVLTTGIYCRPSCAARHPLRQNVRFFASGAEARAAGLRACKRCLPDDVARDERAVLDAIEAIRGSEEPLALAALAARTGYSASHFQRIFTTHTGLSPAAYARALRDERVRNALSGAGRVTDAIYDAGFSAPSRFYQSTGERLGMAPSIWRKGGEGATIRWATVNTNIGRILVAASDKGVCRLSFDEEEADLAARFPKATLLPGDAAFEALLAQVIASVEAPGDFSHIPIDVKGTAFQEAVWAALRRIPAGETRSYSQIAAEVGNPRAVRAAGSANGANHVAVLIPCHRVVRNDGSLGDYAYGLDRKIALLDKEKLP